MSAMVFGPSAGGFVLGMASTVVKPPAAAARVPLAIVSFCVAARLAQVDVHVDQPRRDDESIRLDHGQGTIGPRGRFADAAIDDDEIGDFITAGGGIDDATATNEEGAGRTGGKWRRRRRGGRRMGSHWN